VHGERIQRRRTYAKSSLLARRMAVISLSACQLRAIPLWATAPAGV
jgi:hypothetical protein